MALLAVWKFITHSFIQYTFFKVPASNKLDTTPPLTKLVVQDSFRGSRNLAWETLLFGITGLTGLELGWLPHLQH